MFPALCPYVVAFSKAVWAAAYALGDAIRAHGDAIEDTPDGPRLIEIA